MTANELADQLEGSISILTSEEYYDYANNIELAQAMLRQQAQEIEALKKENEDRESAIYATGYWNGISKKNERA
jgi:hypothetical protein